MSPSRRTVRSASERNSAVCRHFLRGERRDSNPRPPGPQPGALPTELRPPSEAQSSGAVGRFGRCSRSRSTTGRTRGGRRRCSKRSRRPSVKATFFVLGERVEAHPELLERRGRPGARGGGARVRAPAAPGVDARGGRAATSTRRSTRSRAWASNPSGGGFRGGIWPTSRSRSPRARQLEIVGWDADTHDWRGDDARTMLDHLELRYGGIVLAHDGISVGARRDTAAGDRRAGSAAGREGARNEDSNLARCAPTGRRRSRSGIRISIPG